MPAATTADHYEGTRPVREITLHRLTDDHGRPLPHALNDGLSLWAMGKPGPGGACAEYLVSGPGRLGVKGGVTLCHLKFQQGPPKEKGVNGLSNEALLAVVLDRLKGFQQGPHPCDDNNRAMFCLREAMEHLHGRARGRLPAENFPP